MKSLKNFFSVIAIVGTMSSASFANIWDQADSIELCDKDTTKCAADTAAKFDSFLKGLATEKASVAFSSIAQISSSLIQFRSPDLVALRKTIPAIKHLKTTAGLFAEYQNVDKTVDPELKRKKLVELDKRLDETFRFESTTINGKRIVEITEVSDTLVLMSKIVLEAYLEEQMEVCGSEVVRTKVMLAGLRNDVNAYLAFNGIFNSHLGAITADFEKKNFQPAPGNELKDISDFQDFTENEFFVAAQEFKDIMKKPVVLTCDKAGFATVIKNSKKWYQFAKTLAKADLI